MPLTKADKEQVDTYLQSNQPHLARRILEDHLRAEPFDETTKKVLAKINARWPAGSTPVTMPAPMKPTPAPLKTPTQTAAAQPLKAAAPLPSIKPPAVPDALKLDEMDEIRQAIREKRYDDADALLVLSDHPEAEKLRERLAQIRGSGKVKNDYAAPPPDFTNKLVICVVLLFFAWIPGVIAIEIWSGEARKSIDAPGARGLLRLRAAAYVLLITGIFLFVLCMGMSAMVNSLY